MIGRCVVCIGPLTPFECSALHCGHTFHLQCILQWLERSKTCPQCREKTTPGQIVRQLFFDNIHNSSNLGQIASAEHSQSPSSSSSSNAKLYSQIAELENALDSEKMEKASMERQIKQKENEIKQLNNRVKKDDSLLKSLKIKQISLTQTHGEQVANLEALLYEAQTQSKACLKYKAQLKASKFYALLSQSQSNDVEEKIQAYVTEGGDVDVPKFLSLIRRQLEETRKRLHEVNDQCHRSERECMRLQTKYEDMKRLCNSLREEVKVSNQSPFNPKLKPILLDTSNFDKSEESQANEDTLADNSLVNQRMLRTIVRCENKNMYQSEPCSSNIASVEHIPKLDLDAASDFESEWRESEMAESTIDTVKREEEEEEEEEEEVELPGKRARSTLLGKAASRHRNDWLPDGYGRRMCVRQQPVSSRRHHINRSLQPKTKSTSADSRLQKITLFLASSNCSNRQKQTKGIKLADVIEIE